MAEKLRNDMQENVSFEGLAQIDPFFDAWILKIF